MRRLYSLFLILSFGAAAAIAQESRGTIHGIVTDPTGAVVPGAHVKIQHTQMGTVVTAVTNEAGHYEAPFLLPGIYDITVEAQGFKTTIRRGIQLRVADRLELDFVLELGAVTESVVVSAETPLLETSTANLGMVLYTQQVQDLPVVGGNPYYLGRLTPGVWTTGGRSAGNPMDQGAGTQLVVHGTYNTSEAVVDGAPNVVERNTQLSPPQDLVQEFKIQTLAYDASVGHTAGALTSVSIKAGTNELHGTGYFNESRWRAVPWFTNRWIYDPTTGPITEEKKKSALEGWLHRRGGFTLTGPVYLPRLYDGRNRTFFSFGFEKLYIMRNLHGIYTVPTMEERRGDFSALLKAGSVYQIYDPFTTIPSPTRKGRYERKPFPGNIIPASRLDPIALKILQYYPEPNQAGTIDGRNNYFRTRDIDRWNRTIVHRMDHNISDRQRIFVRWNNSQHDNIQDTLPTKATQTILDRTGWGFAFDDVYTVSPETIVNFRYGLTYQNPYTYRGTQGFDLTTLGFPRSLVEMIAAKTDPAGFAFPMIYIDGGAYTQLSDTGGSNYKVYYQTWSGSLTRMVGTHSLKAGGEFRLMRENGYNYGNVAPRFNFASTYTRGPYDNSPAAPIGQGLASMLLGIPTGGQVNVNASRAEQSTFWGLFIHDDWRVSRKLSLNVGVRWEYEGPTTERFNRSVRMFDFSVENPVAQAARANYALNPLPELPLDQFRLMGGLRFAGVGGQPRTLWKGDRNNFAPRFGFAYKLTDKTILRGGYGIFFDMVGIDRQDVNQGGFSQTTNIIPSLDNGVTYRATLANPFPDGIQTPPGASQGLATYLGRSVTFFNPNMLNPYMQRWSLTIQRELPGQIVFEVSYVGNRGTKLNITREFDPIPERYLSKSPERDQAVIDYLSEQVPNPFYGIPEFAGTSLAGKTISRAQLLKPYPHFTSVSASMPYGYSWFHSMQTLVERRMRGGLMFQLSWTYSKFMDATSYLNDCDLRPEEVVSEYDRTHRFVLNGIYELPFGRGRRFGANWNGWLNALLGGWQLQGWYEGQTGDPLGFGNAIFRGNLKDIPIYPVSARKAERWFNIDAGFERDAAKQLAYNLRKFNSRFSGIRGDGINNFDLSMFKRFRVKERVRIEYRLEAFNALNHVQFDNPNTTPTSTTFGQVTQEKGHGQRQITMGIKVLF